MAIGFLLVIVVFFCAVAIGVGLLVYLLNRGPRNSKRESRQEEDEGW